MVSVFFKRLFYEKMVCETHYRVTRLVTEKMKN